MKFGNVLYMKEREGEIQSSQSKKALLNFTGHSIIFDDKRLNQ
jgi:hypothetical protein